MRRTASDVTEENFGGLDFLRFEASPLADRALEILSTHSHLRLLFEVRPDGAMMPLISARPPAVGGISRRSSSTRARPASCSPGVLISLAVLESDFSGEMFTRLALFDPIVRPRHHAVRGAQPGLERGGRGRRPVDVEQGYAFLKRYLEYNRFKHEAKDFSMTVGKAQVKRRQIALTRPGEKPSDGALTASFIASDMLDAANAHRPGSFHWRSATCPTACSTGRAAAGRWMSSWLARCHRCGAC
jgi:hypothetical protein